MTRRLHIPAMRREIKEIVVCPAYVDNNQLWLDGQELIGALTNPSRTDSGFHFVIDMEGIIVADRIPQRPADALTFHNTDSIAVGWVATRDNSKIDRLQEDAAELALTVLHAVFPKAVLVDCSQHTMHNAVIKDVRESNYFHIFADQYEEGGEQ